MNEKGLVLDLFNKDIPSKNSSGTQNKAVIQRVLTTFMETMRLNSKQISSPQQINRIHEEAKTLLAKIGRVVAFGLIEQFQAEQ